MAIKQYRSTMFFACAAISGLLASCVTADGTNDSDDTAEAADSALVHPDSVVASGNLCGVKYSVSQSTSILFVSQSGLTAQTTATAMIDGTIATVVSVSYVESAEVDPTPLADNQTSASARTHVTLPGLSDPPVSATATWTNVTQFNNGNLCTATVTSSMFINYSDGTNCPIKITTKYPTCVTNH